MTKEIWQKTFLWLPFLIHLSEGANHHEHSLRNHSLKLQRSIWTSIIKPSLSLQLRTKLFKLQNCHRDTLLWGTNPKCHSRFYVSCGTVMITLCFFAFYSLLHLAGKMHLKSSIFVYFHVSLGIGNHGHSFSLPSPSPQIQANVGFFCVWRDFYFDSEKPNQVELIPLGGMKVLS